MVVYEFGPFRLDAASLVLYLDGAPVSLGPKVVETLLALVEHAGEVIGKGALLDRIWPEGYVDESNLAQNVYVLRKLLRKNRCDRAIETVARRGYRFTRAVKCCDAPQTSTREPSKLRAVIAAAVAVVVLGAGGGAYALSHEPANSATMSQEARLFAMGNFFSTLRTSYGLERSVAAFGRAINVAPDSARDYAGQGAAYALMANYGYAADPERSRALARSDALRALRLDPRSGRAYAVFGLLALSGHDSGEALADLSTAIALAPSDADAHEWYADALVARGRLDEAQMQLRTAARLNPLSIAATSLLASVAYLQHHYGEAIADARDGLTIQPAHTSLWITLGLALEAQGKLEDAIATFQQYGRSCVTCRPEAAALLAYAYARLGRMDEARAQLAIAQGGGTVRPIDLALAMAAVDKSTSGERLIRRLAERYRTLVANDPRFAALPTLQAELLERGQG